jgi:DNA-binding NarL/FixJ family response regulator
MNIIIFDDHHAIANTLSEYFKNASGCEVIGTFTKSVDILTFLKTHPTDIIITDLLTDEELGTDLITSLRKVAPKSLIVVYSAVTLEIIKECCREAGADLCISKTSRLHILHEEILNLVATKKIEIEKDIIYKKKSSKQTLTTKERIIIECMINGMSSPEIAEKLGLSPNTINNQKNHMIKKFDCNNSTELMAKLFRQGFLKL